MNRTILCVALLASMTAAHAVNEEATTRRAGDLVVYHAGCRTPSALHAALLASADGSAPASAPECFTLARGYAAVLMQRISGTIEWRGRDLSMWQIRDEDADVMYVPLTDDGGRHEALPES